MRKEKNKRLLLEYCKEPKTLSEIMKFLGMKDRKNFIEGYVNPLLEERKLAMTEPDKPTSGYQRYVTVVD
ncbi:MAG: AAA family ATPase [Muribaculaceae bacterium]|nr:AAA family ATPase [Muribaculaceae bacterium]